jgi:hypothetical protein
MARQPALNEEALVKLGSEKLARLVIGEAMRNTAFRKLVAAALAAGILCFVWFRQRRPSLQILNERQNEKFKDAGAHSLLGMGGFCGGGFW